jgi:hypothetical protein
VSAADEGNAPPAPAPDWAGAGAAPLPSPHAWVARACLDPHGYRADAVDGAALAVFAVSVHEKVPTDVPFRTGLLRHVLSAFGPSVPPHLPALWVFPAGYYGYDPVANWWWHCDARAAEDQLRPVAEALPAESTLAVGVDPAGTDQRVWVYTRLADGTVDRRTVTRGRTDLPSRLVTVGPFVTSFFVYGEIVGNASQGPYDAKRYLDSPRQQLAGVQVLVDLSHRRVPKGTTAGAVNPRWAHDNRLRTFASRGGIAVLAHHHAGGGQFDCQSDWILCPGGAPGYGAPVTPVG